MKEVVPPSSINYPESLVWVYTPFLSYVSDNNIDHDGDNNF